MYYASLRKYMYCSSLWKHTMTLFGSILWLFLEAYYASLWKYSMTLFKGILLLSLEACYASLWKHILHLFVSILCISLEAYYASLWKHNLHLFVSILCISLEAYYAPLFCAYFTSFLHEKCKAFQGSLCKLSMYCISLMVRNKSELKRRLAEGLTEKALERTSLLSNRVPVGARCHWGGSV